MRGIEAFTHIDTKHLALAGTKFTDLPKAMINLLQQMFLYAMQVHLKIIARIPINRLQEMTAGKKKVMRRDWVAANGESGGVLWRG